MSSSVFDRVESLLKEHGITFQVLRHEPVYTSEEAARVRDTPLAIRSGDGYIVYFDCYTKGRYGAVRSRNLKDWEDVTSRVSFPKGARHGTVLRVPRSVVDSVLVNR